jgi:heat shock protein HtpX
MVGNWLKTSLLMAAIVALFGVVGGLVGGAQGMLIALAFGGAMNLWAYWFSDRMVLRMYDAQEVDENSSPVLYRAVRELAQSADIAMPRVYLIDQGQPNAFATGRNPENAAVAATTGLLRILSERELRGVIGHELAHIKHRDTLISTISATIAGAVSSLAQFGMIFGGRDEEGRPANAAISLLIVMVAPLAAMLIQFAISRAREFEADRAGAEISGDPKSLASALDKIHRFAQGVALAPAQAHPETAQMMIMNPLSGGGISGLFSTHPDTSERIARLTAMARGELAY